MKVVILTVFALSCLFIQLVSSQYGTYPYYYNNVGRRGFGGGSIIILLLFFLIFIPFLFGSSEDLIIFFNGTANGAGK